MALNQFIASWDLKGVLDNGMDFIDQIVPEDTPFVNSIAKVATKSNNFYWTQDENDDLIIPNPRDEVFDAVNAISEQDGPKNSQSKREGYTQIFRKFVSISKSAAASGVHGRQSETVYQLAKATTALKNQMEATFLSGQIKKLASEASQYSYTDGFTSQIPADLIVSGDITADNVETLIQKLFENGSTADTIFTTVAGAKAFKHLMDVGDKVGPKLQCLKKKDDALVEHFSFTDSNGKLYRVFTSRHMEKQNPGKKVAYFFNSDDWQCVVFRDWKVEELDTTGSTNRYIISGEFGLRHGGRHKAGIIVAPAPTPAPPVSSAKAAKATK